MRVPEARGPLAAAVLALLCGLALATDGTPVLLRALGGLALVFALPGYGITGALLPRAGLSAAERFAMAIGVSLSVTVVGAFLLNALPAGISALSWGLLLGGIASGSALVAWARAPRPDPSTRPEAQPVPATAGIGRRTARRTGGVSGATLVVGVPVAQLGMLAAAAVLVVLSFVVVRVGMAVGPTPTFTELWMLPAEGGASVEVGITNREGRPETYRLVLTLDGKPLTTVSAIDLADEATDTRRIDLPPGRAVLHTVEARIWRGSDATSGEAWRTVRASVRGQPARAP